MITLNFKRWNTIVGWFAFTIALITYSLTVEPTLSFWDCGEYIATAAKLQVGHPPGAPLFQMIGAFFAMFATDITKIALMVNMVSVFSSAFTILFMFWSITMILKKLVSELNNNNLLMILGSALVGVLTFTFSDSFWFNAVEAEVYAMASLFIAILLWLGLRWEQDMNNYRGNKWLLVISVMVGLSFGVHFMALLTIPAIGYLYYFKHYKKITLKNFIIANLAVVAILLFIFMMLLPLTMKLFAKTEIFMVNTLGLPFNSGTIFIVILLIVLFYIGLKYTKNKGYIQLNTLILCIIFIFIGFSTWMMLPIRSNANVIINENKPSDASEVLAYYNREQYGDSGLLYGSQFSDTYAGLDRDNPYSDDKPNYERDYNLGKYIIVNNYKNAKQNMSDDHKTFLPRMWSAEHAANYMEFTNVLKFKIDPNYAYENDFHKYPIDINKLDEEEYIKLRDYIKADIEKTVSEFKQAYASGKLDVEDYHTFLKTYSDYLIIEKPTIIDNYRFMFEYQFGYMYWRYLMWNFVGRQNDIQGKYDNLNGNWISGIRWLDEYRLGSQKNLPADIANNKARNTYFFIPFILGLVGLTYHAKKDWKSFYVLLALFFFTGIALKIYLNERPFEPRERDYALVGSFYVFAIWIGFGVFAIYDETRKFVTSKISIPIILITTLLFSPVVMAIQNWDDHDRSGRYTAIAIAKSYLDSCDPNAILFTIGDNDTFPLWYAQEIENYRTDVRIVNTQLIATDWYIDQMKRKAYQSEPLPISFKHKQYVQGTRDFIIYRPMTEKQWDIKDFIKFIVSDDPKTMVEMGNGHWVNFYPTNKVKIPVNKDVIIRNNIVSPYLYDEIVPYINIEIKGNALYKNRLIMLDIIANNNWKRPIHFSGGSFNDEDYLWMKDYLQLQGMTFKLVPINTPLSQKGSHMEMGDIDADKMYDIVMKWDWGNMDNTRVYHDTETRRNSISYRTYMARLLEKLISENKNEKAKNIITLAMEKMPLEYYDYYPFIEPFIAGYYDVGERNEARLLGTKLVLKYLEYLEYYRSLKRSEQDQYYYEIVSNLERFRSAITIMKDKGDDEYYEKNKVIFNEYNEIFSQFKRQNE